MLESLNVLRVEFPSNCCPDPPSGVQGGSSSAQEEAGRISEEAESSRRGVTPAVRPRVHHCTPHHVFDISSVCVHICDPLTGSKSVYMI